MTDVEEDILKKFQLKGDVEKIKYKFSHSLYASLMGIFLETIFKKKGHIYQQDFAQRIKDNVPEQTFYRLLRDFERFGIIRRTPTNKGMCIFPSKNGNRRTLSDYIETIKKKVGYKGEV